MSPEEQEPEQEQNQGTDESRPQEPSHEPIRGPRLILGRDAAGEPTIYAVPPNYTEPVAAIKGEPGLEDTLSASEAKEPIPITVIPPTLEESLSFMHKAFEPIYDFIRWKIIGCAIDTIDDAIRSAGRRIGNEIKYAAKGLAGLVNRAIRGAPIGRTMYPKPLFRVTQIYGEMIADHEYREKDIWFNLYHNKLGWSIRPWPIGEKMISLLLVKEKALDPDYVRYVGDSVYLLTGAILPIECEAEVSRLNRMDFELRSFQERLDSLETEYDDLNSELYGAMQGFHDACCSGQSLDDSLEYLQEIEPRLDGLYQQLNDLNGELCSFQQSNDFGQGLVEQLTPEKLRESINQSRNILLSRKLDYIFNHMNPYFTIGPKGEPPVQLRVTNFQYGGIPIYLGRLSSAFVGMEFTKRYDEAERNNQ